VQQVPHARFQREGDDLVAAVKVPLHVALSMGTVDVPSLDGRMLRVGDWVGGCGKREGGREGHIIVSSSQGPHSIVPMCPCSAAV
jgi:DnaJ-class molecular chaperone